MERSKKKKKRKIFCLQYQRRRGRSARSQTHTRARTHRCTHCKMYSRRIKREVVDKERRGSNLSAKLLHRWSENVKVSTCAFYRVWVCVYLILPLSTPTVTKLNWRGDGKKYIYHFFFFFNGAGIIRKPIYRDKRYFLLDGSYIELL